MRESEVTGYSEEGCCEPETIYEARVEIEHVVHKIRFMFPRRTGTTVVSIRRADVSDGDWVNYNLTKVDVQFFVPRGTWILHTSAGCGPTWLFMSEQDGLAHSPTITKMNATGKHFDMLIEDDIVSRVSTPEDAIKAIKWHEKAKKEVKSKMLQLIDVIFFNRKTKKIDFRKEIVAVDTEEAYMLAAQEYGKYNSKVHMRHANCLFSFVEDSKE